MMPEERNGRAGYGVPRGTPWYSVAMYGAVALGAVAMMATGLMIGNGNNRLSEATTKPATSEAPWQVHEFSASDPDTYTASTAASRFGAWNPGIPGPRVVIDPLRLAAPLIMGSDQSRKVNLPKPSQAMWHEGTAPIGSKHGVSLIASHADARYGEAAPFSRLRHIEKGMPIEVTGKDGKTCHYKAESIRLYDQTGFPPETFISKEPRLLLVACSGEATKENGGFRWNLAVTARLIPEPSNGGEAS